MLPLLALLVGALALLALAGLAGPLLRWMHPATCVLCLAGFCLSLAALLTGAEATLALPFGPLQALAPGAGGPGLHLALDPLSAVFLLPVLGAGAAAALYASDQHASDQAGRSAPLFPLFLAGMTLTVLAADGLTLLLGYGGLSVASWGLLLANVRPEDETRRPALLYAGMAVFGALCLAGAFGLLAGAVGLDLRFAAMRAAPPDGWRAAGVLVLVLLGAGGKAGLAPLHLWLPTAHSAAPSAVSALLSGAAATAALYVMARMLFDLCGPATPAWWGVPLIVMGAASAVLGALRANLETDLKAVLAAGTVKTMGLVAMAFGVALVARGADLLPLAALAASSAVLLVLGHAAAKTGLFLAAGCVQHGAGSRQLNRLGGLIHAMPGTAACALIGAASLAALPPLAGFAAEWLLLQALLAIPRVGGLAMQILFCAAAAFVALGAALTAAAMVRLVGVAFLGRPRSPRAAAATEPRLPARAALFAMAAATVAIGLLPGPVLTLSEGAIRMLAGAGMDGQTGWLLLSAAQGSARYSAPAAALALALAVLGVAAVVRARSPLPARRAPAWDCGFTAPPPWLPFGDPATQYGALSASQPIARSLGGSIVAARETASAPPPGDPSPAAYALVWQDPLERWLHRPVLAARAWLSERLEALHGLTIRRALAVTFGALVFALVAMAWLEAR